MPFTRLDYGAMSWMNEEKFPDYIDSEQKVREAMQYHPDAIRDFINYTLLKELEESTGASRIGDEKEGKLDRTLTYIYDELVRLDDDIRTIADGDTPGAWRSVTVHFTDDVWNATDSRYTSSIPQTTHNRVSPAFGFKVWHDVDGVYDSATWLASGVTANYVSSTGDVILTAEEPFSGYIVFFGV